MLHLNKNYNLHLVARAFVLDSIASIKQLSSRRSAIDDVLIVPYLPARSCCVFLSSILLNTPIDRHCAPPVFSSLTSPAAYCCCMASVIDICLSNFPLCGNHVEWHGVRVQFAVFSFFSPFFGLFMSLLSILVAFIGRPDMDFSHILQELALFHLIWDSIDDTTSPAPKRLQFFPVALSVILQVPRQDWLFPAVLVW